MYSLVTLNTTNELKSDSSDLSAPIHQGITFAEHVSINKPFTDIWSFIPPDVTANQDLLFILSWISHAIIVSCIVRDVKYKVIDTDLR